jgi:hypothetical protein
MVRARGSLSTRSRLDSILASVGVVRAAGFFAALSLGLELVDGVGGTFNCFGDLTPSLSRGICAVVKDIENVTCGAF